LPPTSSSTNCWKILRRGNRSSRKTFNSVALTRATPLVSFGLGEFLNTGSGPFDSPGLLFMLYACVNMIFWRVFMRISYTCPAHLTFSLTADKWTNLVKITADVIDWLDKHENMYDVWLVTAYSATSCALVQVSLSFFTTSQH